MQSIRSPLSSLEKAIPDGLAALAYYLLLVAAVTFFLNRTVQNRPAAEFATRCNPNRYQFPVMYWIENGYFRTGGLVYYHNTPGWFPDRPEATGTYCYRSATSGHLAAAYVLEYLYYCVSGHYSYRLMAYHNEAIIALCCAALGYFVFKSVKRMGLRKFHSLLLGTAVSCVFLTFPFNLAAYWEHGYQIGGILFAIVFLILVETDEPRRFGKWRTVLACIAAFLCVYIEFVQGIFFFTGYVLAKNVLGRGIPLRDLVVKIIIPASAAVTTFLLQILWVHVTNPSMPLLGSTLMFRTGFDGSRKFVGDHWDLINFRSTLTWLVPDTSLLKWPVFFISGLAAIGVLVWLYTRHGKLRRPLIGLASLLSLYVPFAFFFSQAASIHPYAYDQVLALSLAFALFGVLPASLDVYWKGKGIFTLISIVTAFCYCMVQIRTYALMFPFPQK